MGTRFMATKESPIHQLIKEKIVANDERETELIFRTMRNTSRVARNEISTKVVAMEKEGAKFQDIPSCGELISRIVREAEAIIRRPARRHDRSTKRASGGIITARSESNL